MSRAEPSFDARLSGAGLRVGIVQARFNQSVTDRLRQVCVEELQRLQVSADGVTVVSVPGALEIPFALQCLAQSGRIDCLVAIGCVVRGETVHFELVCNESARGVGDVSLQTGVPIANAILTVENDAQAEARLDKGREAARVAVEMARLAAQLQEGGVQ